MSSTPFNPISMSDKLEQVRYEIRGPVLQEAIRLEKEGYEILKLHIGNPAAFGFQAPPELLNSIMQNLINSHGYCDSKGLLAAREAIVQRHMAQGISDINAEDVYIGNGVSDLIIQSMQALICSGDEILIPAPDYPLWTASVFLSGGKAVHYLCDESSDWFPDPDDIRRKITSRTKAIVLINPNNPTGAVYSKDLLLEIAEIARQHQLIVLSDEIYDRILYDDAKHHSIAALAPDLFTITYNGLSKVHRTTGFRQGWMVLSGPKKHAHEYISGLDIIASMHLGANVPMQHAIVAAIHLDDTLPPLIQPGGRLYEQQLLAWKMLNEIPGISCAKPRGALYLFPKVDVKRFNIHSDQKMVEDLLRQKQVLVVQGSGFNWPHADHFRVVTLPSTQTLELAITKMTEFFTNYHQ